MRDFSIRKSKIYTPCLLILVSARLEVAQNTTTSKPKPKFGYFDCGEKEMVNNQIKSSRHNTSKIKHSNMGYSTVVCSFVVSSSIQDSTVYNSELVDVKVSKNSEISNSTMEGTNVTKSTIVNSNIHLSKIRFSIIRDHPERIVDCCYKYCIIEGDALPKDMEGEVGQKALSSRNNKLAKKEMGDLKSILQCTFCTFLVY